MRRAGEVGGRWAPGGHGGRAARNAKISAVRLCWAGGEGKGREGESGWERAAVSLNGKDRLSLQLSLITFPTILFSVLSPSPEQAEEACSRAQRGRERRLLGFPVRCPCGLGSWWGPGRRWPRPGHGGTAARNRATAKSMARALLCS